MSVLGSNDAEGATCVSCGREVAAGRCPACGVARVVRAYRVLAVITQRPHGRLYRAESATGGVVALKEFAFATAPDARAIEAFEREALLLQRLSHPAIPRFRESFKEGEGPEARLYLVQDWVNGPSLEATSVSSRASEPTAVDVARQVLEVLHYLHELSPQVFHRDVKPANLIRQSDSGKIALVDFGSAREVRQGGTEGGTLAGTLGYMPPEQLAGAVNPTSDLYALGATLVHILTGQSPSALLTADLSLDYQRHLTVSKRFKAFLRKLLARRSTDRFESAAEALLALDSPTGDGSVRPRWLLPSAALAGLLAAGALGAVVATRRGPPTPAPAISATAAPAIPPSAPHAGGLMMRSNRNRHTNRLAASQAPGETPVAQPPVAQVAPPPERPTPRVRTEPPLNPAPKEPEVSVPLRAYWKLEEAGGPRNYLPGDQSRGDLPVDARILADQLGRFPGDSREFSSVRGVFGRAVVGEILLPGAAFAGLRSGSIAFWWRAELPKQSGVLLNILGASEAAAPAIWLMASEKDLQLGHLSDGTAIPQVLTPGVFHHLVVTWSASGKALYVDGTRVLQDSTPSSLDSEPQQVALNWVRRNALGFGPGPVAALDDVRLYEGVLNEADVRSLWQLGSQVPGVVGVPDPPWVAYDEGFDSGVLDGSAMTRFGPGAPHGVVEIVTGEQGRELRLANESPQVSPSPSLEAVEYHPRVDIHFNVNRKVILQYDLRLGSDVTHDGQPDTNVNSGVIFQVQTMQYGDRASGSAWIANNALVQARTDGSHFSAMEHRQLTPERWERGIRVNLSDLYAKTGMGPILSLYAITIKGIGLNFDHRIDNIRIIEE